VDDRTSWPPHWAKFAVSALVFVVLGLAYSNPDLAPTLVVGVVALIVLVLWLGLRQSRR
jgi:hypothetical protein